MSDAVPGAVLYPASATFSNLLRDADTSAAANFAERNTMLLEDIRTAAKRFAALWKALGDGKHATEKYCKENKLTFDSVMELLYSFHVVQPLALDLQRSSMVLFGCSCKPYQDDAVCKHSLYEALKRALIHIPTMMVLFHIGRDTLPGRPKKTTPALSKQPGEDPLPLPTDPANTDPDEPRRVAAEDAEDWWSDGEDDVERGDPELEMGADGAESEDDGWVKMPKPE